MSFHIIVKVFELNYFKEKNIWACYLFKNDYIYNSNFLVCLLVFFSVFYYK